MKEQIIIITTKEELRSVLHDLAPEAPQVNDKKDRLLRRSEVKEMFKISYGTLNNWMKKGIVNYKKIKRVVFFSEQEIIEAIKNYNNG